MLADLGEGEGFEGCDVDVGADRVGVETGG